jgi:mono/diheme cytochrome c family protein
VYAASAKVNFEHYCAQCHGTDGKGKGINATKELPVAPRNLTDPLDLGTFTDDQIFNTLAKGGAANDLSPIMPPWGNTLSREEIRELVKFVRQMCKCVFDPTLKRKKSEPTKLLK